MCRMHTKLILCVGPTTKCSRKCVKDMSSTKQVSTFTSHCLGWKPSPSHIFQTFNIHHHMSFFVPVLSHLTLLFLFPSAVPGISSQSKYYQKSWWDTSFTDKVLYIAKRVTVSDKMLLEALISLLKSLLSVWPTICQIKWYQANYGIQ